MAILTDDFTPRYVGDIGNPLQHQFIDNNQIPFTLVGVNLALMVIKFKNMNTGAIKVGQGSWAFVNGGDAASGIAWYTWAANDVKDPGVFQMQTTVPFSAGPQHFNIKVIEWITPL